MASLRKETYKTETAGTQTGWRFRFYQNRRRRSLWLGPLNKRAAETAARHIDELVRATAANVAPSPEATKWANGIESDRMYQTLVGWGLVDARVATTSDSRLCGVFFDAWIESRTDLAKQTRTKYKQAAGWFYKKFGRQRPMSTITPADFEAWHRWMVAEAGLAQATANKHAKRLRTLFKNAIKARLLHDNPGTDTRIGGEVNRDRDHFIDRTAAAAILTQCDTEWALIFGLCRFAGFRCPSEVTGLKWSDIQWDESRLRVDSIKTGLRFCPIFPELRPLLDVAWDAAPEGAVHVVGRNRTTESNLRTHLQRIVERAGLVMWPKPFVNLRGSCRTDLEERFPSHVVDAWLGHSTKVARKHYLQVTEAHWGKAISETDPTTPSVADDVPGPTPGPIVVNPEQNAQHPEPSQDDGTQQKRRSASLGCTTPSQIVPPLGLEPRTHGLRVRCSTN